jgi:hypothetical protein
MIKGQTLALVGEGSRGSVEVALEHGNSPEEVARALGLPEAELVARYPSAVEEAGRLPDEVRVVVDP